MAFCHNPSNLDHWIVQLQGICGDQQLPRVLRGWYIAQFSNFFRTTIVDWWCLKSSDHFEGRALGRALSSDNFKQIFGQIVSIREKTLSNTNFEATSHIKREEVHFRLTCVAQKRRCLEASPPGAKKVRLSASRVFYTTSLRHYGWVRWLGISNDLSSSSIVPHSSSLDHGKKNMFPF